MAEVGAGIARTATIVHGSMGFTDLLGLHYRFKGIGINRRILGGRELLRIEATQMQSLLNELPQLNYRLFNRD